MTITLNRCQCHELSDGLCAACELALEAELHELENITYDENRAAWDAQNPPSQWEAPR